VLESVRQKRQLDAQAREREFELLLDQGRTLLQQHKHEQAKRVLSRAARLRPDHEVCSRLLAQAEAPRTPEAPQKLLGHMKQERGFKNVALLRQLEMSLFDAEKALEAGDRARARQEAEKVLAGVGYVSGAERATRLRARAEAVLTSARAAEKKVVAAELKAVVAAERERASRDNQATIRATCRSGYAHLDAGELDEALADAEEALRLDPKNKQALFLRHQAQLALGKLDDPEALRTERKKAERDTLLGQIDREMIVDKDIKAKIVLPGDRDLRKFRSWREQAMEPWEQRLRAKLREPVTVEFRDATISEVCRYLSELTDSPVMVDPVVARNPKRFTLPKMTVSYEHALRWLCRFCRVSYALRDHAILVTARGGLLDQPLTRDYDICDLLIPNRSVKTVVEGSAQVEELDSTGDMLGMLRSAADDEGKSNDVSGDVLGERWAQFIRSTVAPETWDEPVEGDALQQQQYTIQYRNGRIVVVHTPEVHEEIARLLDDFRRSRNLQVHILARFVLIDMDFLQRLDVDFGIDEVTLGEPVDPGVYGLLTETNPAYQWFPIPGLADHPWSVIGSMLNTSQVSNIPGSFSDSGALGITYQHFTDDEVNLFIDALLKRRKGSILMAPRLTCFNTQRANFQAVTNFNYVRRVNAENEPEIGNVPEGIIFDIQPFVSADRRYITLVLQPQMRTLVNRSFQAQDEAFAYAIGDVLRVVNLPETILRSVATTVTVPDGGTLLVGGLAEAREQRGESSAPFLHGIPLLRYLLRDYGEAERRISLVILVKAEIVPDIFEE
jgi:tetratricopeptide (TPR) repeat protein